MVGCQVGKPVLQPGLSPASAGLFRAKSPARCATDCRWVCRCSASASLSTRCDLAPPQRGFFVRVPCLRATNRQPRRLMQRACRPTSSESPTTTLMDVAGLASPPSPSVGCPALTLSGGGYVRYFGGRAPEQPGWQISRAVGGHGVTPLKEALTALADALAKRPTEEILFDWFRWTAGRRTLRPNQAPASRGASRDRSRLPGASGEARQTVFRLGERRSSRGASDMPHRR